MTVASSGFNMVTATQSLNQGLTDLEMQMQDVMTSIASSASPSQSDLIEMQTLMNSYTTYISLESSIIKSNGDTMKQVANNMGS